VKTLWRPNRKRIEKRCKKVRKYDRKNTREIERRKGNLKKGNGRKNNEEKEKKERIN
jgi:hypothetical protein